MMFCLIYSLNLKETKKISHDIYLDKKEVS